MLKTDKNYFVNLLEVETHLMQTNLLGEREKDKKSASIESLRDCRSYCIFFVTGN